MKTMKLMLIMILMTTAAWAQTRPGFEVGAQLIDYSFRQSAEGELVEKDEARFSGITAGYTKTFGNGAFAAVCTSRPDRRTSSRATASRSSATSTREWDFWSSMAAATSG